jgi:hypothetical protein
MNVRHNCRDRLAVVEADLAAKHSSAQAPSHGGPPGYNLAPSRAALSCQGQERVETEHTLVVSQLRAGNEHAGPCVRWRTDDHRQIHDGQQLSRAQCDAHGPSASLADSGLTPLARY